MQITLQEARRIILSSQGLSAKTGYKKKAGTLGVLEHLGYVQIDTLSVSARAHHHTLWSRVQGYEERFLSQLLAEKKIFEYWSHAASYLPMSEFRFSLVRKKLYASGKSHWFGQDKKLNKFVFDRIRAEGPLQSKDFEHIRKEPGNWYAWKPAKRALEQLFMEGKLMVAGRKGFQKVYDLSERVLPAGTDFRVPGESEYCEHLILQAIAANGIVSSEEISYLRGHLRTGVQKSIARLLKSGQVDEIEVERNGIYLGHQSEATKLLSKTSDPAAVHILSPFDNSVIQRKRLLSVFGFDYTVECYVPEAKRKFGYFCLPVLQGDQFVARFDPKADRATGIFHIKIFHSEKGWKPKAEQAEAFADKLRAFATFCGCNRIESGKDLPSAIRKLL
jgi:hypothetical protein